MPKYMVQAAYSVEGMKGLVKDGGSKRRAAVEQAAAAVGGKVEAFYYAFGATDAFIVLDLPDAVSAAAIGLAVGATGAVRLQTTPLLSVEDIDAAIKKQVGYRAPGA